MNKLCKKIKQEFICQDELNDVKKSNFKNHINTCKECADEFKKFNALTNILDVKKDATISNPTYWANYTVKLTQRVILNGVKDLKTQTTELDKKENKTVLHWLKLKPILTGSTIFLMLLIIVGTLFVKKPDKSLLANKNLDDGLLVLIESNNPSEVLQDMDIEILNSLDEEFLDSILFHGI